jgi:hypothetical protein
VSDNVEKRFETYIYVYIYEHLIWAVTTYSLTCLQTFLMHYPGHSGQHGDPGTV